MQECHSGFDVVVRIATQTIHLVVHDGSSVREHVVSPPFDVLARFGDPIPVLSDSAGRAPAEIVGDALTETVDGSLAGRRVLVLAPDAWGPHRHDLLAAVLSSAGARPSVCPETEFLLTHHSAQSTADARALWLRVGSESTTAALVHRDHDRLVHAHRVEFPWGGDDIDDQLIKFVSRRLPESTPAEGLRTVCRAARERLSDQVAASVATSAGDVYIHRKDIEELAGPSLSAALTATLRQVLALSDQAPTTVLVSGGTARMPFVAQLASDISGQPVCLVDWRDAVSPLLLRSAVSPAAVTPKVDEAARTSERPITEGQLPSKGRRRVRFAAVLAGGVAVLACAAVAGSQLGGSEGLMRMMLGEGGSSVPGGPPGAHAALQSETPFPTSSGGSPRAPSAVLTHSTQDRVVLAPGEATAPPEGSPSAPGAPSIPPANPTGPVAPPSPPVATAPAPAPPAPAPSTSAPPAPAPPAPAPTAPAPPAPAPTADPPPPTTTAPPPPPSSDAPPPAEPPTPPEPASAVPAAIGTSVP